MLVLAVLEDLRIVLAASYSSDYRAVYLIRLLERHGLPLRGRCLWCNRQTAELAFRGCSEIVFLNGTTS